jgi:hypothetical protein
MRTAALRGSLALVLASLACTSTPPTDGVTKPDSGFADLGPSTTDAPSTPDAPVVPDRPMPACDDADHDGISDRDEGAPSLDTDGDMTPDYMDTDSDGDGFTDADEAARRYPGYEMDAVPVFCGNQPNNCDAPPDNLANQRDLDSDNDGLTDAEERTAMTNPCAEDTDRDGFADLAEVAARSNPRDMASRPPENSLYVTLPYYAPGTTGMRETREFTFATRIREADVFFLVDNSASMDPTIANLRTNLQTVIIPGIRGAIPDARLGVGSFDSMPDAPEGTTPVDGLDDGVAGRPGDYTFWVRQRMTTNTMDVQRAFDGMRTIVQDSGGRFLGGDAPECQIEAMFEALVGDGTSGNTSGADPMPIRSLPGSLRSVTNALDPMGNGWVAPVDPARDCPETAEASGWACFRSGRVPILVMFSDAAWYDGPQPASPRSIHGHRYPELAAAMLSRGALFLGVDVSAAGTMGFTYANSVYLARATGSLNAMRREVVFAPASSGGLDRTAAGIVDAVRTLANETRQDITTTVLADPMEMRLPAGRTTAAFVQSVTPVRADPEMPTGYERRDDRTFFGVLPTTRVVFRVSFYNDFLEGTDAARVFQASVVVRGRAGSEVDRRPVFIVVPARGGGLPPG